MDEFELIRRYFHRTPVPQGVRVGIGDDGAVLQPTPGKEQVQVVDTLVAGVHFPADTAPDDIAYRAVAVNLSDIAAMGALPRWMTLALTLEQAEPHWLQAFAGGLFAAAEEFAVGLVGGDTTRGPVLTVTINMTGELDTGSALTRQGARVGDGIFLTGTVGDAAAGLELRQSGETDEYLERRFFRPTPRVGTGRALAGRASAAIDVSDGLLGDLGKLLTASGVGADVECAHIPLSAALKKRFSEQDQLRFALTGGDDYELCFTARDEAVAGIAGLSRIGTVTRKPALIVRRNGAIVDFDDSGYRHFQ